jgi:hypothetical protein
VATDDIPRSRRKGVKCFLYGSLVSFKPTLRSIFFDILAPNGRIAMDRVTRDADDRAFWEELAKYRQSTLGNNPWEAYRRCGVHAETFVDASIEIRKAFDLITGGHSFIF